MPKASSRKARPAAWRPTSTAARRPASPVAQRPGPVESARRAAYARPAVLGTTMVLLLTASLLWAIAASTLSKPKTPTPAPKVTAKPASPKAAAGTPAKGNAKLLDWSDLPSLMKAYGQRRAQAAKGKYGTRRFALTEADLTSNTPSDERESAYSFNGDYIAFSSNGTQVTDASGNTRLATGANAPIQAHYHIWIMKSDGSRQRQITGLTTSGPNEDDIRDQRFPSWDPAGNQIVYTDRGMYPADANNLGQGPKTELYVVRPFDPLTGTPPAPPTERRTFSGGDKRRPTWSSSGLAIAFATNVDPRIDNSVTPAVYDTLPSYDIFTIDPSGQESTVVRITGTTTFLANPNNLNPPPKRTDATGDTLGDTTDDLNPAYSQVNTNILFFSSNRDSGAKLAAGRRIFLSDSTGRNRLQVTDPTQRKDPQNAAVTVGTAGDTDDFPAPSAAQGSFTERVGFQSDSYIDSSDDAHDFNIWSVTVDSNSQFVAPALIVGSFGDMDKHLHKYNYPSGTSNGYFNPTQLAKIEDVLFGPAVGGAFPNLFVSERSLSQVESFNGATGADQGTFASAADLTAPTGLAFDAAGNLYVADGNATTTPPAGSTQGRAVHRFHPDGSPFPAAGQPAGSSVFTDGGGTTNNSNGFEGIVFGPDDDGDRTPDLFVSSISDGVLEYSGATGVFLRKVVSVGPIAGDPVGLSIPTGLTFGPAGDTTLYVASSGTDDVKRYNQVAYVSGTPAAAQPAYTYNQDFVADNNGAVAQLNDPERIRFGPDNNLYVSSFSNPGAAEGAGNGDHVNRYFGPFSGSPGAPDPSPGHTGAVFAQDTVASATPLIGPSGFDFNPSARGTTPTIETIANQAVVETNRTSSPRTAASSLLTSANPTPAPSGPATRTAIGEDKSADREPSFSGQTLSTNQTALLAFSSQRVTAAAPGSDSLDPTPIVENPFGGPENANDSPQAPPTHDIWTTRSQDFTPPTLLAQSVGSLKYPVVAPGPQAPVAADPSLTPAQAATANGQLRTFESGLRPDDGSGSLGTKVTIGVVIQETESGLGPNSITATIRDADQHNFVNFTPGTVEVIGGTAATGVDENIPITAAREIDASIVPGKGALPMTVYDDGPVSQGGHELEGGAIAGDGIYYCVVTTTTPTNTNGGDFYIDINTRDRAGNAFIFDHIWGFSTRQFTKSSANSNLFVSDYTVGQLFPIQLVSIGVSDLRYSNMIPVESYFLTNPGGFGAIDPSVPSPDTWRILCRGPVPKTVFDRYTPTVTFQLDYDKDFATGLPPNYPNTPKTKSLAVATSAVVWGAPYAGLVFAGPGTIFDADAQSNLTQFLDNGGRFFLSGQDVLYSLSGQGGGTPNNTFIQNELRAAFKSEANPTVLAVNPAFPITFLGGDFDNLHLPLNPSLTDTYIDAALNRHGANPRTHFPDIGRPVSVDAGFDLMTPATGTSPVANQTTVFNAYTTGDSTVGQYIEQTRKTTRRESRVAFFGFGFEQIDRRYTNPSAPRNLNVRWRVCRNLLDKFFDTASIRGQVVDTTTNTGVPNFLVQAVFRPGSTSTGQMQKFIAQTDSNGNYSFIGLPPTIPSDDYTVQPAFDNNGKSLNLGYRGATPIDLGGSVFGAGASIANFRVTPIPPGTLTGVVMSTSGTPSDRSDDTPIPNVPVLVKSGPLGSFPGFPNGGEFAELVTTDAGGRFRLTNVPASDPSSNAVIPLTVILNPNDRLESDTGPEDTSDPLYPNGKPVNTDPAGDIPVGSGISYGRIVNGAFQANGKSTPAPRTDLRRRQLPDSQRSPLIYASPGDTFILNDNDPPDPLDATRLLDNGQPLLLPKGPSVGGKVLLNGVPLGGALVQFTVILPGETALRKATTVSDPGNTDDGTYTFFDVPAGTYTITATPPASRPASSGSVTVTVATATSNDITNADILLFKQDVRGTVSLNSGTVSPAGFTVTLYQNGQPVQGTTLSPNPVTITAANPTGAFTFLNVAPGSGYTVVATNGTLSATAGPFTVKTGFDVAPSGPTATTVIVPELAFQFFVRSISGTVTLNGAAVAGAKVELLDANGTPVGNPMTSAADGSFAFATVIAPANYFIRASITVGLGTDTNVSGQITLTTAANSDVSGVVIPLFLYTIRGKVTLNGVALAGAPVDLSQNGKTLASTTTAADGSYTFANLSNPPGATTATYILTSSSGGDTASVTVSFGRATTAAQVNVTARTIALFLETIRGKVTLNGVAVAGATVQLNQNGQVLASTTTATDGSYSFPNLLPGVYTLTGSYGGDTATVPVAFARATTVAETIVTAPEIKLLLETITGRVTLNGQPFAGATVYLIDPSGKVLASTVSAAGGLYQFANEPAGNYILQATATAAQLRAIGAGAGDTVQVAITVTRGVNAVTPAVPDLNLVLESITGRVLVDGQPTSGATVQLLQNGAVLKTMNSGSNGTYTFTGLLPGSYTIQASQGGDVAQVGVTVARGDNAIAPDIKLFLETISGKVALNNVLLKGATVLLIKGTTTQARATTDASGSYKFTGLLPGTYRVRALYGGDQFDILARVTRGGNAVVPTIRLFLETITGRVTLNGKVVSGAKVTLTQGDKSYGTVATTSAGTYSYSKLAAGAYTITATKSGVSVTTRITVVRAKNLTVPDLQLKIETVSGQVLLNGKPLGNTTVFLLNGDESNVARVSTDVNGHYSFTNVPDGTYIVRVTGNGVTQDVNITVRVGVNLTVPTIRIVTATPTPVATPGATPRPTGANTYVVGQTYQISIPYMDSTAADATTTPAKAFNLPPVGADGTLNYHIFRRNAQTQKDEELSNTSLLHRGEGYFLRPDASDVSMNDPASDPTRKPTSATSFTVVLRNNPSIAAFEPHNGFNLIGSPFNPAAYSGADFLNSQVITPDGHVYPTVSAAVAALVLSPTLFTLDETTGNYAVANGTLGNFQGYYVRTFVNGAKLVLKPSR